MKLLPDRDTRPLSVSSDPTRAALEIANLTKCYGRSTVVDDVSLCVERGQMVAFLGPSGCGKTTTLRMLAGLVTPTRGRILLDGSPVDHVPVHRRNIGMFFQQYALFPFMSVFENVAYGLRERHVREEEIARRVAEMLLFVGLSGLDGRRPRELSGGQQQRVALARALVINPALLLLDEPLSNLDTKLRVRVRREIRALQRKFGITTVFVTHDQEEALSIADVIVVMRGGRIEQIGAPLEIYQRPANAFVADFIGTCNLIPARVVDVKGDNARCELTSNVLLDVGNVALNPGDAVTLGIRPERLNVVPRHRQGGASAPMIAAVVKTVSYLGAKTSYDVDVDGVAMRCDALSETAPLAVGSAISLTWRPGSWQAFR